MSKLSVWVLVQFLFLLFFCSCSDPGWPPTTSETEVANFFHSIRQSKSEGKSKITYPKGKAIFLSLYDGSGIRDTVATANMSESTSIKTLYNSNMGFDKSYITLSNIVKISKIHIQSLCKWGITYEKGLQGVALSENGEVRGVDPVFIAARDLEFTKVVQLLQDKKGIPIKGLDLKNGLYLLDCESFTEPVPGQEPVALFRANTLIQNVSSDQIRKSIILGGDQLVNLQKSDGRFVYEYFPGSNKKSMKGYNLLRHAGTCYSLFSLYKATGKEKYLIAGRNGIEWLLTKFRTASWDDERVYPVYNGKAKLGGAALSLMALCERAKVDPDFQVTQTMHKLAKHLCKEQKQDGSFHSYYSWNNKSVIKRHSIYYPGEAILALSRYHKLVPGSDEAAKTAIRGVDYLIDKRWKILGMQINVPPDAWLMLALSELWDFAQKDKYVDYCLRIADSMASDQHIRWVPDADYHGGFFPDPPQVTPAGARMEGITAAYLLAQKAGRTVPGLLETIKRGVSFQIRMQIRHEFDHLFPNPQLALGTFRHSPISSMNRIDYNQHNISGLIVAANILEP